MYLEDRLHEWEKFLVYEVFQKISSTPEDPKTKERKKPEVTREEAERVVSALLEDGCYIGKVPDLGSMSESEAVGEWDWGGKEKMGWNAFRDNVSKWGYVQQPRHVIEERVEKYFKAAYKAKM